MVTAFIRCTGLRRTTMLVKALLWSLMVVPLGPLRSVSSGMDTQNVGVLHSLETPHTPDSYTHREAPN